MLILAASTQSVHHVVSCISVLLTVPAHSVFIPISQHNKFQYQQKKKVVILNFIGYNGIETNCKAEN